jgi:hypothetical protein
MSSNKQLITSIADFLDKQQVDTFTVASEILKESPSFDPSVLPSKSLSEIFEAGVKALGLDKQEKKPEVKPNQPQKEDLMNRKFPTFLNFSQKKNLNNSSKLSAKKDILKMLNQTHKNIKKDLKKQKKNFSLNKENSKRKQMN